VTVNEQSGIRFNQTQKAVGVHDLNKVHNFSCI